MACRPFHAASSSAGSRLSARILLTALMSRQSPSAALCDEPVAPLPAGGDPAPAEPVPVFRHHFPFPYVPSLPPPMRASSAASLGSAGAEGGVAVFRSGSVRARAL